ncbi:rolling circle replication-associated protein [Pseudomonas sp. CGJS7]|uniref:rolling circle replication-associated protein n=1 Tax=Pseudomonas sp. CGJS7 TaxID=3109348 RepID=UPI003008CD93
MTDRESLLLAAARRTADAHGSCRVSAAGAIPGLVNTGTSQTGLFQQKKIITAAEQREKRLRKMKQNVITSARLLVEEGQRGGFRGRWAMLTLTYRDDERWVAKQVAQLLDCIRKYAARCGFTARYTWVLELTKRGRPHYHVLVWLPKGRSLPKPDKQGWWKHGLTRIEWARNAVGYLAKYASKGDDYDLRTLPKGARLSGNGGLSKTARIELRWWKLPRWLREVWNQITDVGRIRGGYVNRPTGEFLASPYRVVFIGGALVLCEAISHG